MRLSGGQLTVKPETENDMGGRPQQPDETTWRGQVAAHLRELRIRAGWTQPELAVRVANHQLDNTGRKIGKATISQWELGIHQPKIDDLPALAGALGVSVPELFPYQHMVSLGSFGRRRPKQSTRRSRKKVSP
jgi:hypothetical protein